MSFQKLLGLVPGSLTFVSLIDHIFADGHLLVVDEGGKLFIYEVDKVARKLPGDIDVLNHFGLITHFAGIFSIENL